jgi:hypothetical protein
MTKTKAVSALSVSSVLKAFFPYQRLKPTRCSNPSNLGSARNVMATHRMPLWYYLTLHPDARLSPTDAKALTAWAREAK